MTFSDSIGAKAGGRKTIFVLLLFFALLMGASSDALACEAFGGLIDGFAFVKIASKLADQIRIFSKSLRLHAAGRKSIGYTIVMACTLSFAPKLIVRTRSTT